MSALAIQDRMVIAAMIVALVIIPVLWLVKKFILGSNHENRNQIP